MLYYILVEQSNIAINFMNDCTLEMSMYTTSYWHNCLYVMALFIVWILGSQCTKTRHLDLPQVGLRLICRHNFKNNM